MCGNMKVLHMYRLYCCCGRSAVVHGVALTMPHESAFRKAWFIQTGQPLPASIDFFVSGWRHSTSIDLSSAPESGPACVHILPSADLGVRSSRCLPMQPALMLTIGNRRWKHVAGICGMNGPGGLL